jgi:hypothetical protein
MASPHASRNQWSRLYGYTRCVTTRRIRWRRLALGLLLVLVAVGVVLWYRSKARPEWWAPPNPRDPHIVQVADRVEYQLVEQAQLVRPVEDVWGVRVYESQVNAWLASRLPKWLAHHDLREWSDAVRLVQVHFDEGAVVIGAEIGDRLQPRVVSIRLVAALEDGRIAVTADSVSVGRISIGTAPIDRAVEELRDVVSSDVLDDPAVAQVIETLRGERTWPAEFKLADGRHVEVLELALERGAVSARCRTKAKR